MDQVVEVRTGFTPDDEAITRLHRQAFGVEGSGVEPWGDRLRRHSVTWAGAFLGQEIVAFVHVVGDGGTHGFLLDTVVHPDHRRTGLGTAVVTAAVDGARAAGCVWLHVDFEPHLETFYRDACGFASTRAGLRRLA
jgi:GNAT superfamily N-acetyltransferase